MRHKRCGRWCVTGITGVLCLCEVDIRRFSLRFLVAVFNGTTETGKGGQEGAFFVNYRRVMAVRFDWFVYFVSSSQSRLYFVLAVLRTNQIDVCPKTFSETIFTKEKAIQYFLVDVEAPEHEFTDYFIWYLPDIFRIERRSNTQKKSGENVHAFAIASPASSALHQNPIHAIA